VSKQHNHDKKASYVAALIFAQADSLDERIFCCTLVLLQFYMSVCLSVCYTGD